MLPLEGGCPAAPDVIERGIVVVRCYYSTQMIEGTVRHRFGDYLSKAEVAIYSVLAVLLSLTALMAMVNAGRLLWDALVHRTMVVETFHVLDQLLVVLMLVEILHTVRVSIRSHILVTEPFLVVGLIASIRRILVITLEAATLTKEGSWTAQGASIFRASMIELGLLGLLVLVLVFCITLLRRHAATPTQNPENNL
jgi:Phosphate-starvation-inducible E family